MSKRRISVHFQTNVVVHERGYELSDEELCREFVTMIAANCPPMLGIGKSKVMMASREGPKQSKPKVAVIVEGMFSTVEPLDAVFDPVEADIPPPRIVE